jgi:hypothetical protein
LWENTPCPPTLFAKGGGHKCLTPVHLWVACVSENSRTDLKVGSVVVPVKPLQKWSERWD